ncbi:MAG TPA: SgcJ/EcaC family oxidoreductase [Gemmatimonadaceae bacterium]|nr:SgcJ/EcaC family oxidoreductase [Gemmatimonadaceae bacterium]
MHRIAIQVRLFRIFLIASAGLLSATASAQRPAETQIRDVEARQADAWNRHDARAYASLFTPDGDVVNVVGWWWKGRPEIERKLAAGFAFVFARSTLTISDVTVRFLSPSIAVAHVQWTMTGARTPPGMPEPRQGIQLQILRKTGREWLIASFQNTNSIPEREFPTGPPTAAQNRGTQGTVKRGD